MSRYIEKIDKMSLKLIPLHGIVLFPAIPISFEITSKQEAEFLEKADREDGKAFFVLKKKENFKETDDIAFTQDTEIVTDEVTKNYKSIFENIGCVATIKQFVKYPDGNARVVVEGISRASVSAIQKSQDGSLIADVICKTVVLEDNGGIRAEAYMSLLKKTYARFVGKMPKASEEIDMAVRSIISPGLLSDFIACNLLVNVADKQKVLKEFDPIKRIEKLVKILSEEEEVVKVEADLRKKVQDSIDTKQREYYLREQLKVIQSELSMGSCGDPSECDFDEDDSEINEYMEKLKKACLSGDVYTKIEKEIKKLAKTPYNSAEAGVIRNYLDICLALPWNRKSDDTADIVAAKKILDRDHDGLEKVKERILEYLAVKQLNPELKNQVICLVGPPGTGKTSVAQSIAVAMKRKYVRVSL